MEALYGLGSLYALWCSGSVYQATHWEHEVQLDDPAPAGGAVRRVLLLNVTYEPLTTVGLRRAVCLVLCGKAEVVHDDIDGAVLHGASVVLATPSVIRLSRYVRVPYRNRVPLTRAALMRRDNYRCAYCGHKAETIDHVIPRSRG